ncbi:TIGR03364 family FAD-dependent oxidoreductase [Litoribacillus peritrichatus]|uniref:TIGR03364 family FAD-dependent oxidoreductase n=1 Tax=Litoribacillus peritrichatus TaxID=718191 RepID=A0ABP7M877_9GAMM
MFDLIIVGGGIAGLAFALKGCEAGKKVLIIEKNEGPNEASIRNFGMVLPLGMPKGSALNRAMKSKEVWKHYAKKAKFWANECGMLMVAHHDDEMAAMEEFHTDISLPPYQTRLLNAEQAKVLSPGVNPKGLRGALFSQTDVLINPQQALTQLTQYLYGFENSQLQYNTLVSHFESNDKGVKVVTNKGVFEGRQVVCCPGHQFASLFDLEADQAPTVCKLQMVRTLKQTQNWAFGPMMSTGLSMLHYPAFDQVKSLQAVRNRVEQDHPELIQYGIHLLAAQHQTGEITLGDSHEYGNTPSPFINQRINQLILEYAQKVMTLPSWELKEQWIGIYSKAKTDHVYWEQPQDNLFLITGLGGTGMSTSFAIAEEWFKEHQH